MSRWITPCACASSSAAAVVERRERADDVAGAIAGRAGERRPLVAVPDRDVRGVEPACQGEVHPDVELRARAVIVAGISERQLQTLMADVRIDYHFRVANLNQTFDVTTTNRYFQDGATAVYEEQAIYDAILARLSQADSSPVPASS